MKLRNKKTGEIHEITEAVPLHDMDKKFVIYSQTEGHNYAYKNLAELNEEWEDYEEPKGYYYYIDEDGVIQIEQVLCSVLNMRKSIGNYYDTREEAEKACDKLKAWKRLKDKGFRFNKWTVPSGPTPPHFKLVIEAEMNRPDFPHDLDLLFGGEE